MNYSELKTLIDAYVNRNGVQAITGSILNGVLNEMVEQLGRGYQIMGVAEPDGDPGLPDGPECWFAGNPGTYTNYGGITVVDGEIALLCYDTGWTKRVFFDGFADVEASVDSSVGTPSASVSYSDGVLTFTFSNLKGEQGDPAEVGGVTASVDDTTGTPEVTVTTSGPDTAKNIDFAFKGLKGETGDPAGFGTVSASVDANVGTPSVTVQATGPDTAKEFSFDFKNLKGEQGEPGTIAAFNSILATVDAHVGTPHVDVLSSGPDTAKDVTFRFSNLKGEQGIQGPQGNRGERGVQGPVGPEGPAGVQSVIVSLDNNSGNPYATASVQDGVLSISFHNLKGDQGNTGSSVDYPYELVNNLTTNDAEKGLSAAMGVQLEGEIVQLSSEVNAFNEVLDEESGNVSSDTVTPTGSIEKDFEAIALVAGTTYKFVIHPNGYVPDPSINAALAIHTANGTTDATVVEEVIIVTRLEYTGDDITVYYTPTENTSHVRFYVGAAQTVGSGVEFVTTYERSNRLIDIEERIEEITIVKETINLEQGSLNADGTKESSISPNRVRTANLIRVYDKFRISIDPGYQYYLFLYTDDDFTTEVSSYPYTGGDRIVSWDGYIGFVIKNDGGTAIVPTDPTPVVEANETLDSMEQKVGPLANRVSQLEVVFDGESLPITLEQGSLLADGTKEISISPNRVRTASLIPVIGEATISINAGFQYYLFLYSANDFSTAVSAFAYTGSPRTFVWDGYIGFVIKNDDGNAILPSNPSPSVITAPLAENLEIVADWGGRNIKLYGAKGDGVSDDTGAFVAATSQGGKIVVPEGTYLISSRIPLHSNTEILLQPGAVLKRNAAINALFFTDYETTTTAYNGQHDIRISGGTLDMGTGYAQGGFPIGLIHAQNIRIENVTFKNVNSGYHCVDCCGSKNVKILNCVFQDFLTTNQYGEAIQIDGPKTYTSFPMLHDGSYACWDDTPCFDVEVAGCLFLLNDYSPAVGNHNDAAHKYIDIHDNVMIGTGNGSSNNRGAIAFGIYSGYTTENIVDMVKVHDNTIVNFKYGFEILSEGQVVVYNNIFRDIETLKTVSTGGNGTFQNNFPES